MRLQFNSGSVQFLSKGTHIDVNICFQTETEDSVLLQEATIKGKEGQRRGASCTCKANWPQRKDFR